MPELPDVQVYVERLQARLGGRRLAGVRIASPFLLRTVTPPPEACVGRRLTAVRRLGKRLALGFEGELWLVLHLRIAGRLRWRDPGTVLPPRRGLLALDFSEASVVLTEEGSKKRASLHVARGEAGLAEHDPGGLEPLEASLAAFRERLETENHTVKRALCTPRLFSGIGNAYSDEILHRARLSPLKLTSRLKAEEVERLWRATRETLEGWLERLRAEVGDGFPEKVTAFREGMAVHGRFGKPCPDCGAPVQRIVYATNETDYCPGCQTEGRILADRALSRLLKDDWPRSLDDLD